MIPTRLMPLGRGGKRGPTARDYVQSGLVAVWDGIENAGWGVHDPNATFWVNLANENFPLFRRSGFDDIVLQWTPDSLSLPAVSGPVLDTAAGVTGQAETATRTVEMVAACNYNTDTSPQWTLQQPFRLNGGLFPIIRNYFWTMSARWGQQYTVVPVTSGTTANSWTPASMSVTGSASLGGKTIVVNGESQTQNLQFPSERSISYTADTCAVARSANADVKLFCIRVYNRALTAVEVAWNYSIDKVRFNLP